jgi:hypothetical protein
MAVHVQTNCMGWSGSHKYISDEILLLLDKSMHSAAAVERQAAR